jgi:hypothetical protein
MPLEDFPVLNTPYMLICVQSKPHSYLRIIVNLSTGINGNHL